MTSVLVILGAAIAYHILMQQALYKVVHAVGAEFHATTLLQHWRPQYAALVPLVSGVCVPQSAPLVVTLS